ncbi:MAG: hypothetical protein IKD69_06545, partial [Solobacterium sp.]|nr:hypothetical protein [Solobacterium sp.]
MEEHLNTNQTPIVIYHFFDLTDADYFCRLLEGRFRSSGHTRRIVFRKWNCYHELPGQDADILVYDAIIMSALAEKGFLHQLPEIINIDGMFSWLIDKSKVRKKTYGIPLMLCANALICRKKDDQKVNNIMDIHEPTAIALHSMVMFYYLQSFCNYQDRPEKIHAVFEHLVGLVGGRDLVERSHLSDYDGISRFNRRECRYFLGYTENIR